jgi:hypothetical protein
MGWPIHPEDRTKWAKSKKQPVRTRSLGYHKLSCKMDLEQVVIRSKRRTEEQGYSEFLFQLWAKADFQSVKQKLMVALKSPSDELIIKRLGEPKDPSTRASQSVLSSSADWAYEACWSTVPKRGSVTLLFRIFHDFASHYVFLLRRGLSIR